MEVGEYGRSVHAEMAGLMEAARRGVAVKGATLYTTTFPCHNCARHIVAAGVKRVVYVEPYPKSQAERLHSDSISVDPTAEEVPDHVVFRSFVGVAPRRYVDWFTMEKGSRKGEDGRPGRWVNAQARLRSSIPPLAYIQEEKALFSPIDEQMRALGLTPEEGGRSDEQPETGMAAEAEPSG